MAVGVLRPYAARYSRLELLLLICTTGLCQKQHTHIYVTQKMIAVPFGTRQRPGRACCWGACRPATMLEAPGHARASGAGPCDTRDRLLHVFTLQLNAHALYAGPTGGCWEHACRGASCRVSPVRYRQYVWWLYAFAGGAVLNPTILGSIASPSLVCGHCSALRPDNKLYAYHSKDEFLAYFADRSWLAYAILQLSLHASFGVQRGG